MKLLSFVILLLGMGTIKKKIFLGFYSPTGPKKHKTQNTYGKRLSIRLEIVSKCYTGLDVKNVSQPCYSALLKFA